MATLECAVDRKKLQNLAEATRRRQGSFRKQAVVRRYYLCGYAIECALKACLLRYLGESDAVFGKENYLKKLAEYRTHDLAKLLSLAGLEPDFGVTRGMNAALDAYWSTAKDWNEISRYEHRTESEAKTLYEAIVQKPDGVMPWIQTRW